MCGMHDQMIKKVEVIWDKILEDRYNTTKKDLQKNQVDVHRIFVFHAIDKVFIDKIEHEGFKVREAKVSVWEIDLYAGQGFTQH